ncbi:MAG: GtrA family protein [Deltaproteobacteria bacterium]|jgi:putative flippase GtrA|nr:GtrA family protein [Deltaproteobacteria bacterium]
MGSSFPWQTALLQHVRALSPEQFRQIIRFGLVGVAHNGAGYLLYLVLTWLGAEPKLVVAVCYPVGVLISFFGNKKFTFKHKGDNAGAFFRFVSTYAGGYFVNLAGLYIFFDILGYPHQWVQLGLMIFLAACFFLLQKLFVFPGKSEREHE